MWSLSNVCVPIFLQEVTKRLSLPADIRIPGHFLAKQSLTPEGQLSRRSRRKSLVSIANMKVMLLKWLYSFIWSDLSTPFSVVKWIVSIGSNDCRQIFFFFEICKGVFIFHRHIQIVKHFQMALVLTNFWSNLGHSVLWKCLFFLHDYMTHVIGFSKCFIIRIRLVVIFMAEQKAQKPLSLSHQCTASRDCNALYRWCHLSKPATYVHYVFFLVKWCMYM